MVPYVFYSVHLHLLSPPYSYILHVCETPLPRLPRACELNQLWVKQLSTTWFDNLGPGPSSLSTRVMGLADTPILKTKSLRPMFSRKQRVCSRQCDKMLPLVAFAAWPLGRHRFERFMRFTKPQSKESAENDVAKIVQLPSWRRSSSGNRRDMKGWPVRLDFLGVPGV